MTGRDESGEDIPGKQRAKTQQRRKVLIIISDSGEIPCAWVEIVEKEGWLYGDQTTEDLG